MNWLYKIRYFFYSYFGLFAKERVDRIEKAFLERGDVTQQTGDNFRTDFHWGNTTENNGSVFTPECVVGGGDGIMINMHHTTATGKYYDPKNNWEYTYAERPYISGMVLYEKEQLYGEFACRLICPTFLGAWWAFWSCSQKQWPPEIDHEFFWYKNANSISPGHYWGKESPMSKSMRLTGKVISKVSFRPIGGDIILSYEWRKDFIEWKINGLTIRKTSTEIPEVAMQQIFGVSCHINHPLPKEYLKDQYVGSLKIKWFRAWK